MNFSELFLPDPSGHKSYLHMSSSILNSLEDAGDPSILLSYLMVKLGSGVMDCKNRP